MAYSELIKNFEKIRDYMREFYVYGFKNRNEYTGKSARSYDNERRRMESWLGEYMAFRQNAAGKRVFLSVDSRNIGRNPLYKAFKAKSFTSGDITLHFYLLDLLPEEGGYTIGEVMDHLSEDYYAHFDAELPDESTVRKKLKEYEKLGLIRTEKRGREKIYRLCVCDADLASWRDAVAFFSEEDPLGVIGSYLSDRYADETDHYRFKHHYLLHPLDSEILHELLLAIGEKRKAEVQIKTGEEPHTEEVLPMKIYISTQWGRRYLLAYHYRYHRCLFYRLDHIGSVKTKEIDTAFDPEQYETYRNNLWGVSLGETEQLEHIEMTVYVHEKEPFIVGRLEREKRNGTVEKISRHYYRYSADVYDPMEMMPWIRTFIGRIVDLKCSVPAVEKRFYEDMEAMYALYGGDDDAVS